MLCSHCEFHNDNSFRSTLSATWNSRKCGVNHFSRKTCLRHYSLLTCTFVVYAFTDFPSKQCDAIWKESLLKKSQRKDFRLLLFGNASFISFYFLVISIYTYIILLSFRSESISICLYLRHTLVFFVFRKVYLFIQFILDLRNASKPYVAHTNTSSIQNERLCNSLWNDNKRNARLQGIPLAMICKI